MPIWYSCSSVRQGEGTQILFSVESGGPRNAAELSTKGLAAPRIPHSFSVRKADTWEPDYPFPSGLEYLQTGEQGPTMSQGFAAEPPWGLELF